VNGIGKSHYFRRLETDRHHYDRKKHRSDVGIDFSQPHKKAEREYRNPKDCIKLMVKGTVATEYFIPGHKNQIEGIKHLGKRIGIKREARRLRGGP
jgi:hypothetical protein